MAQKPTQGADTPRTPADTGGESASGSGADTPDSTNVSAADTGGDGGDQWKALAEEARAERDKLRKQNADIRGDFDSLKSSLAQALGVAPVQGDDDPAVVIKQVKDELAAERAARQELEKGLARERVLRGVTNTEQAEIVLAGLEATGAVDLTTTDPAAIREQIQAQFAHLFAEEAPAQPKPAPRIPTPKNGSTETPKWNRGIVQRGGRIL